MADSEWESRKETDLWKKCTLRLMGNGSADFGPKGNSLVENRTLRLMGNGSADLGLKGNGIVEELYIEVNG